MTTAKLTDDMIRELCALTTRDEAGRHFTQWAGYYDDLESLGLVHIHRPVHAATAIPYSIDHWSVAITDAGQEVVDGNPELHPE